LPSDFVQVANMTPYKSKTKKGTTNKEKCIVTAKEIFTEASNLHLLSTQRNLRRYRDFSKALKSEMK
jgi:hypothetical protein